jgi:hypothetical protein
MNERETERRLQAWLDAQRGDGASAHLRARVAAIPAVVTLAWPERFAGALGILPGPQARLRRVPVIVVLVALLGAIAAAVALVGGQSKLVVVPPTASPAASPVTSPTPSQSAQTPRPFALRPIPSGDLSCVKNLIRLTAGGKAPSKASQPPVPAGGRFAYVMPGATNSDGLMLDARIQIAAPGSVATVATVASDEPFGLRGPLSRPGSVTIEGWSTDGNSILVWAGRWGPSTWYHNCSDLYLVRADGTSALRLTDNGRPGYSVGAPALAPEGRSAAYVEFAVETWSVRISDASGATTIINTARCEFQPDLLAWSRDGLYLAVPCDQGVLIYNVAERTSKILGLGGATGADHIGWDQDSGRVEAVIHDKTLKVLALDPLSGSQTVLASVPGRTDLSVLGISDDGTQILLAGCPIAKPSDPSCFATDLDVLDVGSGTLQTLWSGPGNETTNELINSARSNSNGTVVMNDPDGSGTLVIDPTGRSTHSDWPIGARLWLPRN